jgi:DNA topoisomerase I
MIQSARASLSIWLDMESQAFSPAFSRERQEMRYCMKSLVHNGIYVPQFEYNGFSVKIQGQLVKLSPATEQMAVFWVRKRLSPTSPPDKVFYRNFGEDFLSALRAENTSLTFLASFQKEHLANIGAAGNSWMTDEGSGIDFSQVTSYVLREQQKKLNMSKEEKKKLAAERKGARETLKERYGFAVVDGKRLEIANWTAEPSCIFAGRGDHPKRGKWKQGPRQEDIILNLSPDAPTPPGNWKGRTWEPESMYIAKWEDKLTGKMKYVWFSDSAFLKQEAEEEKFKKAENLDTEIPRIRDHIVKNLESVDPEKRKIATVSWLILEVNMRVGDEKDPGEADTVGAITLRPEHVKVEGSRLDFDFLGKDCVRWTKSIEAPVAVINNIKAFSCQSKEYLFEGINSRKVSRFLSEKLDGLTAKVFRTWRCTKTVKEYLQRCDAKKESPDYAKHFCAKMANLEAAKIANHKRKIPVNFDQRLVEKRTRIEELEAKLKENAEQGKKTETYLKRLEKSKYDFKLVQETKEYNLGTSLKSYIDPAAYVKWAKHVDFQLERLYPKTLQKKYSWALGLGCK